MSRGGHTFLSTSISSLLSISKSRLSTTASLVSKLMSNSSLVLSCPDCEIDAYDLPGVRGVEGPAPGELVTDFRTGDDRVGDTRVEPLDCGLRSSSSLEGEAGLGGSFCFRRKRAAVVFFGLFSRGGVGDWSTQGGC